MRSAPRSPLLRSRLAAVTASLALLVAACGGSGAGAEPTTDLTIVATTTTLGDVVRNVVGDDATVEVLMPVGADPHDFQASSAQVAVVNGADLVVANGLFLEEGLEDVLEAAEGDGANVFRVAPLLDPIPFGEHGHDDHDEDHEEGESDHDHEGDDHEGDDHDHEGEDHDHDGLAHACGHFDDEPTSVESGGAVDDDHTRYTIGLGDGATSLTLDFDESGDVSFFLGVDVPLTLTADGSPIEPESTETVGDDCEAVAVVVTFDLDPGSYAIDVGPSADAASVDLVWEMASGHDHEEGEDGHDHEGESDHEEGDDHDHEGEDGHDHEGEDGHDHAHGDEDPHVWMDPLRMADAARLIAEQLTTLDDSVDWMASAEAYAAELEAADAEIVELLESIPEDDRKLVTNHESMGYFADRYDFEMVGVVVPGGSTLGDPSSEELADLVATMQAADVDVIFAETTDGTALADAVSDELGSDAQVVQLFTGSLGEPGSDADTLIGMLTTNAELIADALG